MSATNGSALSTGEPLGPPASGPEIARFAQLVTAALSKVSGSISALEARTVYALVAKKASA